MAPQGLIVVHRSMVKSLAAYDTLLLDIGLLVLLGLIMGAAQVRHHHTHRCALKHQLITHDYHV